MMDLNVVDFSKICRACLSDSGPFKDLFLVCTPKMYKYCTSVKVSRKDELPKQICQKCLEMLNKLFFFKEVAIKSNSILQQQVLQDLQCCWLVVKSYFIDLEVTLQSKQKQTHEIEENTNEDIVQISPDGEHNLVSKDADIGYCETEKSRKTRTQRSARENTKLKCLKCKRSFQTYENFEVHMRSHFGIKSESKCGVCGKTFSSLKNLSIHSRIHSGLRKYQCRWCGKRFTYLNVLKNHEMLHTGDKKYACNLCDAAFVQQYNLKSDLKKHMMSHSTEKPFSCDQCDKTFKNKTFQVIHMRSHTGERPYCCDFCPKAFRSWRDCRNHEMIHTGERPYSCPLCEHAFIQRCALNRHLKGHARREEQYPVHNEQTVKHINSG
ncbi:unnamed protein product [Diatraea saccharalis]|uniref:Uncharacterized protein n=1 Tax=Diatraea saccharalis TaxID=40085 RepID=A0A9N9RFM5_9NEOP|nr:unnamed protein product [Diatraea saccharalis]